MKPKVKMAKTRSNIEVEIYQHPLFLDDETIEVFDNAVSAAEDEMQELLSRMSPEEIVQRFEKHLKIHMATELEGARRHGNIVANYREAVNEGEESAF